MTVTLEAPGVAELLGLGSSPDPRAAASSLAALATVAHGRPVHPGPVLVTRVPYAFSSPATGGLLRIAGTDQAGEPWSLFCKILQHVRHWPTLPLLPTAARAQFLRDFPWRGELDAWEPAFADRLPDGLRLPRLHLIVDLGEDRLAVWMEDVPCDPRPWDLPRFARAARLLGQFAARSTAAEVLAGCPLPPGFALRMYAENSVGPRGLAPLADDALWSHPRLADHAELRRTLRRLGARIPELLDRLDALPQSMPHGDASPQNLLVPIDEPQTLVAIDISFQSPHAVGFDLGQLLVGLVHADVLPATQLPAVAAVIVPAYVDGLSAAGSGIDAATVAEGFWISLLLRTGLDSLRYDLLDAADAAGAATLGTRLAMTRFIADHAETVIGP